MIGEETKVQILKRKDQLLVVVLTYVGGCLNAIGMFFDFIDDTNLSLIGVESARVEIVSGQHRALLKHGNVGIYFGMKVTMIKIANGQNEESCLIPARQDFSSVGS